MPRQATRPTIGVLAGWQFYWTATPLSYLSPIFRGIRLAARELDCNLLLACGMGPSAASSDPMRPAWPLLSTDTDFVPVGHWNTDGLVAVNPLHSAVRSRYLSEVQASGHPVVYIGSGEQGPAVVADNALGILAAMRHLFDHGHRHIAFIGGSLDDLAGDSGARLRAYHDALQTFGLPAQKGLVAYGRHTLASGYAAMQQILTSGEEFTAVCASNDESALGAMQALKETGRRVPEDVAVIGFDDRPEGAAHDPTLSSVHVPLFLMGYRAVELLLRRIGDPAAPPASITIATHLVPRASCGCERMHMRSAGEKILDRLPDPSLLEDHLAAKMAAAVLAETHQFGYEQVRIWCHQLIAAFVSDIQHPRQATFRQALDWLLSQTLEERDEIDLWQHAVSILAGSLPDLVSPWPEPSTLERGYELLDYARVAISAGSERRHRKYVVDQHWTLDRVGMLTAQLLSALDETEVYDALAEHLPLMGITLAAIAELAPEGEDSLGWSTLRMVIPSHLPAVRLPTRSFPPEELAGEDGAWSLALVPLVSARRQIGYGVFDTSQLALYGAIVQQVAAALNTAQLYRDATEGRRLAEEASRMKSRFLSTVSHELRTPLNLIVGLTGLLLQEENEDDPALSQGLHSDIERIHANAQHLGALINDVLDLASSEAGGLRLAHELVDLGQLLRQVALTGRRLAQAKGLGWRQELPDAGPWVWGDRTRLQQVALNLISNAIKFTTEGEVCLTLAVDGSNATVTVSDTGIGIPLGEQQAIFEDFRRSERSINRGIGGMGLGLAICRLLVELHGGAISVSSPGQEGLGAEFTVTLPVRLPPVDLEPSASPAAELSAPLPSHVLVLTSEAQEEQRLVDHLRRRGFTVEVRKPAGDLGQQLPAVIAAAAIVLDVSRPTAQDWQMLQILKTDSKTRHIPLLLYAGSEEGGALLNVDYLSKPIELAALNQALDQQWLVAGGSGEQHTILVVDDDAETLEMHVRIVQSHSAANRVLTARNGREALALLERIRVDLVLLDLLMPELDGFSVLEAMRAQASLREVPVIVVTGQVLTEAEMARLNQGVTAVMGKGLYSMEETLAHLESALARKRKLNLQAQSLVRKAMAYLHEHYAEPLTRGAIAQYVGLDEDYLTYCFRQELGITPIAYLNRYRINQAKQLLKQSGESATAIALQVGFSDSGYFSRVFRRETGMSPEAYRRA
jgi:signal transduction histidine kinase/DNA-binding LacI/PurR family transcriptional regulator/AraC-like DNA-binding protein